VGYSLSFPYGTGVLQTPPLNLLVSSLGSRHVVLVPYDLALQASSDTIFNDPEKITSQIYAITLK